MESRGCYSKVLIDVKTDKLEYIAVRAGVTGHITEPEYTIHHPSTSPPSGATIEDYHRRGQEAMFRI